ncbi:MAG: sigma-70 family RNA polymerase sigma factor [Terriglobia bacterium]
MQKSPFKRGVLYGESAERQNSRQGKVKSEATELYQSFAQDLFRYLLCLTRNFDLAQEAVQETFLRYYEYRLKDGTPPESRGWFFRVARNYVIDQLRATKPDKHVSLEEAMIGSGGGPDPYESLVQLESLDQLSALLAPRELECLELRAEGFKYREIAQILGIEPGTVGATLAHGLKKIRAFYVIGKEGA